MLEFDNLLKAEAKKRSVEWFKKIKRKEDYTFVKNEEEYNNIKKGGYIRYFNLNDEIRWGGILLKKYKYEEMNMMILGNSSFKRLIECFDKNTVFNKKHTTQADKTRKLFLSYLDKYDE